jgi:hypothetical protein
MPKLLAFVLLFLITGSDQMEKKFFSTNPPDTWVAQLRQYSLEDQYKIFRYGIHKVRSQAWSLANPIAEKGIAVMPFLTAKLNSADDLTVYDILVILWQMNYLKAFEARQDTTLMHLLEDRVPKIKNPDLQYMSRVLLDDIKVGYHTSSPK